MHVVTLNEFADSLTRRLQVAEDAAMDRLRLERAVEALSHSVGLRFGNEGWAGAIPQNLELVEEMACHILCAMIEAQGKTSVRRRLPSP